MCTILKRIILKTEGVILITKKISFFYQQLFCYLKQYQISLISGEETNLPIL